MKRPDDFDIVYREAWAIHQAYRRLGYPSENIALHQNPDGVLCVILKHMTLQFAVTVGVVQPGWETTWSQFSEAVNNGTFTDDDLMRVWQDSVVCRNVNRVSLFDALKLKGFPLDLNRTN